jgi:O-antigen/teichoic acid export membrane protein
LSVQVLIIYAVTYVIITPTHVQILMLIAAGRHGLLGAIVLAEAVANLLLSLALVSRIGPVGAAVSTLLVVSIDDLLVIPIVASRRLGVPLRSIATAALIGVLAGAVVLALTRLVTLEGTLGLFVRAGIGAAGLAVVATIMLRRTVGQTSQPIAVSVER